MAIFEGDRLDEANAIMARYPEGRQRSAVMPLLYLAQSVEGRVTRDALREVAGLIGVRTAEVEAVASFYTMLRLRPTGDPSDRGLHEPVLRPAGSQRRVQVGSRRDRHPARRGGL